VNVPVAVILSLGEGFADGRWGLAASLARQIILQPLGNGALPRQANPEWRFQFRLCCSCLQTKR
jgi:hypothetical protein